jgi:HSP20 family protein
MTTVTRFDPFREISTIAEQLLRSPQSPSQVGSWVPPVDIVETEEAIHVRADLPGIDRDGLEIEFDDNVLSIRGERQNSAPTGGADRQGFFRVERPFGRFARSIALPAGVQSDSIQARYDDGVLTVVVPKAEHAKPRRISIS